MSKLLSLKLSPVGGRRGESKNAVLRLSLLYLLYFSHTSGVDGSNATTSTSTTPPLSSVSFFFPSSSSSSSSKYHLIPGEEGGQRELSQRSSLSPSSVLSGFEEEQESLEEDETIFSSSSSTSTSLSYVPMPSSLPPCCKETPAAEDGETNEVFRKRRAMPLVFLLFCVSLASRLRSSSSSLTFSSRTDGEEQGKLIHLSSLRNKTSRRAIQSTEGHGSSPYRHSKRKDVSSSSSSLSFSPSMGRDNTPAGSDKGRRFQTSLLVPFLFLPPGFSQFFSFDEETLPFLSTSLSSSLSPFSETAQNEVDLSDRKKPTSSVSSSSLSVGGQPVRRLWPGSPVSRASPSPAPTGSLASVASYASSVGPPGAPGRASPVVDLGGDGGGGGPARGGGGIFKGRKVPKWMWGVGAALALATALFGYSAHRHGGPAVALRIHRMQLRRQMPLTWGLFMNQLPEIDEARFPEFADILRILSMEGSRMIKMVPQVSDELATFLHLDEQTRKDGVVIKVRGTEGVGVRKLVYEINAHMNIVPKNPFFLPIIGGYRGTSKKGVYLIMPRARSDVAEFVKARPFEVDLCLATAEMTYALHLLHQSGFLHRDIKASNYFVGFDGHAMLADFEGVGVLQQRALIVGTKGYIAPEINHSRDHTVETDIYALGKTFRRLVRYMRGIKIPRLRELTDLIKRMIHSKPEDRPSLTEVMKDTYFAGIDFTRLEAKDQGIPFRGNFERPKFDDSLLSVRDVWPADDDDDEGGGKGGRRKNHHDVDF
ncbi:rhoptry kinase family protein rop35 [Cystoisospora suis]|uniref:non-specific serine/threonine protein kinase n=1 Tax=Cystoisospora suis TaxID=483139 RepID=A0A2C6KK64_9APIC|nr:rhoptry kinase family protein rop35 [Cystoisospora suis]